MLTITPLQLYFKFIKEELFLFNNKDININKLKNHQFNDVFIELLATSFHPLKIRNIKRGYQIRYAWQKIIYIMYKSKLIEWIENELKQKDCLEKVIRNFQEYNNTSEVKNISDILDYLLEIKNKGSYPLTMLIGIINYSFFWSSTQEGHRFWSSINNEFNRKFNNLNLNKI